MKDNDLPNLLCFAPSLVIVCLLSGSRNSASASSLLILNRNSGIFIFFSRLFLFWNNIKIDRKYIKLPSQTLKKINHKVATYILIWQLRCVDVYFLLDFHYTNTCMFSAKYWTHFMHRREYIGSHHIRPVKKNTSLLVAGFSRWRYVVDVKEEPISLLRQMRVSLAAGLLLYLPPDSVSCPATFWGSLFLYSH